MYEGQTEKVDLTFDVTSNLEQMNKVEKGPAIYDPYLIPSGLKPTSSLVIHDL